MDDLVAFLTARLDEDERMAKAAAGQFAQPVWILRDHPSESVMVRDEGGAPVVYDEGVPSDDQAAHIARHDPARVLREVAAKRAILAEHERSCCVKAMCCGEIEEWFDADSGDPCPTLRILAAVYSDHPDYREEWKP